MSLPKRGSRIVVVDGTRYRWVATGKGGPDAGFVAELADAPTGRLIGSVTRWAVVTPGAVARGIRAGRAGGWDPARPGPVFHLATVVDAAPIRTP
jgi:hypothetical protein